MIVSKNRYVVYIVFCFLSALEKNLIWHCVNGEISKVYERALKIMAIYIERYFEIL